MDKFSGIIFDIDGTLTSSNQLIFASFNHIAEKYLGKHFTDTEITKLFGPTEDVILKQLCPDNYEEVRKDYYDFYERNHSMAALYPGIIEILDILKHKKILLSIYTGKGRDASIITLKEFKIYNYFDLIITGDEVKEHKPSPEGITLFLDKFNLPRHKVLMVGDAPADIKASRAAGVKVASVVWDSYSKEAVLKLNPDYLFNSVNELKEFLLLTI
ncbi:MAG: HAD family hydrolase [Ignavibacteriaceae bacterium]|nr:HAD family hydrolase [Ignavibacteriaceae bacterium]